MGDTENKPENEDPDKEFDEIPDRGETSEFEPDHEHTPALKDLLKSYDSPSRKVLYLAFFLIILAGICIILLFSRAWKHRHPTQKLGVTAPVLRLEPSFQTKLGEFKVSWPDGELRADLVVQCASQIACEEIETRKTDARDRVLPLLQNTSRSEILNPARKQILRQQITDSLNEMKLSGKVMEVNFSDLTVEIGH